MANLVKVMNIDRNTEPLPGIGILEIGEVAVVDMDDAEVRDAIRQNPGQLQILGLEPSAGAAGAPGADAVLPASDVEFTVGPEVAHVRLVNVRLIDSAAEYAEGVFHVSAWISEVNDGLGANPAGIYYNGMDNCVFASGSRIDDNQGPGSALSDLFVSGNKQAPDVLTASDGSFSFNLEHAGATTLYTAVILPTGKLVVSDPIVFAG